MSQNWAIKVNIVIIDVGFGASDKPIDLMIH
jgi:hypothetical protein